MTDITKASGRASASIRAFSEDHPFVAGAAIGGTAAAIAAGTPTSTAALVGAIAGVAAQAATGKGLK